MSGHDFDLRVLARRLELESEQWRSRGLVRLAGRLEKAAQHQEGYQEGYQAAKRAMAGGDGHDLTVEQLRGLVTLTHPDRHPPERFEMANRLTAKLLGLLQKGK